MKNKTQISITVVPNGFIVTLYPASGADEEKRIANNIDLRSYTEHSLSSVISDLIECDKLLSSKADPKGVEVPKRSEYMETLIKEAEEDNHENNY
jgi:hypothetical protein